MSNEVEQLRREVNELRERVALLESRTAPLSLFGSKMPQLTVGNQLVPQGELVPDTWKDLPPDGASLGTLYRQQDTRGGYAR